MASSFPSKLHNFDLPEIWGNEASPTTITKRSRYYKPPAPPSQPPSPDSPVIPSRVSPVQGDPSKLKESAVGGESEKPILLLEEVYDPRKGKGVIEHNKNHSKESSSLKMNEVVSIKTEGEKSTPQKSKASSEVDDEAKSKKSKILIKLPAAKKNKGVEKMGSHEYKDVMGEIKLEVDNSKDDPTICEMSTRRQKIKLKISGGDKTRVLKSPQKNNDKIGDKNEEKSGVNKVGSSVEKEKEKEEMKGENKKKKLNIRIPLTKQEIEEDIFALTGSKPEVRPKKKRTNNVQRNLKAVFPGLCLSSITSDKYKVGGSSRKRNR